MALTPEQRRARGRLGAFVQWSRTPDRAAHTAPARAAFLARFEAEVDPAGELGEQERADRAEYARRAHFQRLALRSSRARAARKAAADASQ